MGAKNPFSVLGFAPAIFKGLFDSHIRSLVQSQYRALSLVHHPDKGGNPQKFREISEAFAILEEEEMFSYWKDRFLKPRKEQINLALYETEDSLAQCEQINQALMNCLTKFWQAFAQRLRVEGAINVFTLTNARMLVSETLKSSLKGKSIFAEPNKSVGFKEIGSMCELVADERGMLRRYPLEKVIFDSRHAKPPKSIPEKWVSRGRIPWQQYYWKRCGKGQDLNIRIVAGIDSSRTDGATSVAKRVVCSLLSGPISREQYDLVERGFAWSQVKDFVHLLSPLIKRHDELVAFRMEGDSPRFLLIGSIKCILRT